MQFRLGLVVVLVAITALSGCQTASPTSTNVMAMNTVPPASTIEMSDEMLAALTSEERSGLLRERAHKRFPELMARLDAISDQIAKSVISNCLTGASVSELLALKNGNECVFRTMAKNLKPRDQIEQFCVRAADIKVFESCVTNGSLIYRMKQALGEKSLPSDWTAGKEVSEGYWQRLLLQSVISCAKSSNSTMSSCLTTEIAKLLQVPDADLAYCLARPSEIQVACMAVAGALATFYEVPDQSI